METLKTVLIIIACMYQWLFLGMTALAADECEVTEAYYYERAQGEIVTEPGSSYPYGIYRTMVYPCADVTVRDNYGSLFPRIVEITATFNDGSRASKIGWCDKKNVGNEVRYFCIVCFEKDSPISDVTCDFRLRTP
jgi:hypothetical protein